VGDRNRKHGGQRYTGDDRCRSSHRDRLTLTGIGTFSVLAGAVAHKLIARAQGGTVELTSGEQAILARLDELTTRLPADDGGPGERHAARLMEESQS
jgi:hypothetical protein